MTRSVALSLWLGACAYEAPVDNDGEPILGAISGTVVYGGAGEPGNTYVTLFSAENPGPPAGTGRPLTFAAVAGSDFTQVDAGLVSADFALTQLASGSYLLGALMDQDGDFSPLTPALAGATCGDWGGAHLDDLVNQNQAPVEVSDGRLSADVTVLLGAQFSTERPAFHLVGEGLSLQAVLTGQQPPLLRVQASPIATAFSETLTLDLAPGCEPEEAVPGCTQLPACPCAQATLAPCAAAVWGWLVDADADGLVDPYPAPAQAEKGLLDIWPRVYLEYAGTLSTFEHEGVELPERWVAEAFPLAGEISVVAAGYGIPPGAAAGQLGVPVGVPTALHDLSVTFAPVFRHYHVGGGDGVDPNGPFDLLDLTTGEVSPAEIPTGGWSVTLVSFTGQTWTVPNEIGGLPSTDPEVFPEPERQGAPLELAP
jgi:hypothetical protein